MSSFKELYFTVLNVEHGQPFCTRLQFRMVYELLLRVAQDIVKVKFVVKRKEVES